MRIAFEGTTLQPERTGVGYYSEHLLRHLEQHAPTDDFVVISNRAPVPSAPLPARLRAMYPRRPMVRLAWMQAVAPRVLRRIDADVAHFTNGIMPVASRVPAVVTIHDMSLTLYPECHPTRRLLLKGPLQRLAAERAAAIITPSAAAKRDLVRLCRIDEGRVHVVHEAAAPEFQRVADPAVLDAVRRRYALPERFILYVGAIEPRKNLRRLLEAFAARHRAGDLPQQLVCVGPYGWLQADLGATIDALGIRSAVSFTGYVPFDDLPAIYSLADIFVFPSIYEGFGLPVMEALACGAPTIVSSADALVEIGGRAVEVVDPFDTVGLGDALTALARDDERRRDLSVRGLQRAAEFSWARAASETMAVYRRAAAQAAPAEMPRAAVIDTALAAAPAGVDVLIGHAYYLRFDAKLWDAQQPYPPLGTLYAAAYLRSQGQRVSVFDAMLADSEADWAAALDRARPRAAVIFEDNFNYLSKMCLLRMREASLTMIDAARARGVPVIVSGSDASDHPEIYLDRGAACVVVGEGEVTLAEALAAVSANALDALASVQGICYRAASGQLVRTSKRPFIKSLDELPRPAWDLIDVSRYQQTWRAAHGSFSMNIATTRGCPYSCNWCAKPIYGQRYTTRSPRAVVAEMAWLKDRYAPDHLWFVDDIFGLAPGWIEAFAALAAREDAVIPFKCLMRADGITPSVAAALKAARCRTVWIGAESGSQKILDAMDKGIAVADIERAAALLHEAGIEVGLFLQFGYPGETRADIALTERLVRRCQPDDIGISISYPLPGTPFYERVRAELGAKQNWFDSNDLAALYKANYRPEFYRVLHRAVHAEFRVRKAGGLVRALGRPWSLRVGHLRQLPAVAANLARLPFLRWELRRLSQRPQEV